jgi:hypothetical protein
MNNVISPKSLLLVMKAFKKIKLKHCIETAINPEILRYNCSESYINKAFKYGKWYKKLIMIKFN